MSDRLFLNRREFLVGLGAMTAGVVSCQAQTSNQPEPATSPTPTVSPVTLFGAGATFPYYLYQRWFAEYNRMHPHVQISYQPVGSAAGIQQFISGTLDFGASEVTPTDADVAKVKRGAVFVPTAAGGIAVVYNLPNIKSGLKLSREVLPAIFLGEITNWNDPAIAALNPDLTLPDLPIAPIHRSDGSGTTAAFTAHLSAISPAWKDRIGTGLNVEWQTGTGIKDNAGIAAQIQQGSGTIGYVEYAFAMQLELAIASLQNKANEYISLTEASVTNALASIQLSDDLRGSVPDPDKPGAYPIVTYSWLLAYNEYPDASKAQMLKDVFNWGLSEGQKFASELGYVSLPTEIITKSQVALSQITA